MIKRWSSIALIFLFCTACSLSGRSSLQVLSPIDSIAQDLSFSPDGQLVAVATLDDGAKLWRVADKAFVSSLSKGRVNALAFSPDGRFIVTGGDDNAGSVSIWNVADGALIRTLDPSLTPSVQSLDISSDGSQLAVGTDENVHLFNFADGSLLHTFDGFGMHVTFSPDGQQLAIAENLPVIRIWSLKTYEPLYSLAGHGFSTAYSSDGSLFAAPGWNNQGMVAFQGAENFATTAGGENEVQVWNAADGSHLRAMNTHGGQVHSLAFSPDNQFLVSGGNDNTVRLSRVADGREVGSVKLDNSIDNVAFSPDGTMVAIAIYQTLYLWPIGDLVQTK